MDTMRHLALFVAIVFWCGTFITTMIFSAKHQPPPWITPLTMAVLCLLVTLIAIAARPTPQ